MDYNRAASFWTEHDKSAARMPEHELRAAIEDFIHAHSPGALAAASGNFVRCTPLTYKYCAGKFAVFSEGGLKFRALRENKHVALAVCDEYRGPGTAKGLQVTGTAAVFGTDDADYAVQLEVLGINAAHMQKLGLILILITPQEFDYLDGTLKDKGYSPRQHLDLS